MTLTVEPLAVPLRDAGGGALRVGDSRVVLDVVINEYKRGTSPEGIVRAYDTLKLADVYAVIAYYPAHRAEVDTYLQVRREEADRLRQEIQGKQPDSRDLRSKLLARRAQTEQGHAAPGK